MDGQWISGGVEFNEGDLVKIMCNVADCHPNGMGLGKPWNNTWADNMNDAIGRLFTIAYITEEGVHFAGENDDPASWYAYPLRCMENMTVQRLQDHSGDVHDDYLVN